MQRSSTRQRLTASSRALFLFVGLGEARLLIEGGLEEGEHVRADGLGASSWANPIVRDAAGRGLSRASPSSPTNEASAASGRHECSPLIGGVSSVEKRERPSWLRDAPIAGCRAPIASGADPRSAYARAAGGPDPHPGLHRAMLGGRVAERPVEVGPVDADAMRDLGSRESGLARELVLEEVASSRDGELSRRYFSSSRRSRS